MVHARVYDESEVWCATAASSKEAGVEARIKWENTRRYRAREH